VIAYTPALFDGRLLGPGDGGALHFPDKAAVWSAYRQGVLPAWNPQVLLGTPLLAAYHPGAFFPLVAALCLLPPFVAFQSLVLLSLAATGPLLYAYVRMLGAGRVGAYFSGLSFALGPYFVAHLGDTPTLVAAPVLPLLLIALEAFLRRASAGRSAGLAAAVALLLLAGSPEAVRAGAGLLLGRVLVAFVVPGRQGRPPAVRTLWAVLAGVLLAAPQLLPTLLLARDAGPVVSGLVTSAEGVQPGATGLVLRYASHTPAPSFALAALPLLARQGPVRILSLAVLVSLGLQWGRGPLAAPGSLPLLFELTLSILAGFSLSAQWQARREPMGRRLRAYFLVACLASAAALSVAAAALGPLPQTLAGAVGVLALAIIVYLPNAADVDPIKAGVFLLPLTVSFVLQPYGRRVWADAPSETDLQRGSGTRSALDRTMGASRDQPALTLATSWPRVEAADLAFSNLAGPLGRRSVNGYVPIAPWRTLEALGGMRPGGLLPPAFLQTPPSLLEGLGVRWVQVPAFMLAQPARLGGADLPLESSRRRFFPFPIVPTTEVRVESYLSDAADVGQDDVVALVHARLAASGRDFTFALRAGTDTAERAYDDPDVHPRLQHRRAPIARLVTDGPQPGYRYEGSFALPGRYYLDGVGIERAPGPGQVAVTDVLLYDAVTGRVNVASGAARYLSDAGRFRDAAVTPSIRLFEVPAGGGRAHVVAKARVLAAPAEVLASMRGQAEPTDPLKEALLTEADARGAVLPTDGRVSVANMVRNEAGLIEVRAEGPGLLVVAESWDPGWSAALDGRRAPLLRVNHAQMALTLSSGLHRAVLRYRTPGVDAGLALGAAGGVLLLLAWVRERRSAGGSARTVQTNVPEVPPM
jgi:hypothetical protein